MMMMSTRHTHARVKMLFLWPAEIVFSAIFRMRDIESMGHVDDGGIGARCILASPAISLRTLRRAATLSASFATRAISRRRCIPRHWYYFRSIRPRSVIGRCCHFHDIMLPLAGAQPRSPSIHASASHFHSRAGHASSCSISRQYPCPFTDARQRHSRFSPPEAQSALASTRHFSLMRACRRARARATIYAQRFTPYRDDYGSG